MYKFITISLLILYFLNSCSSSKIQLKNKDLINIELKGFGEQKLQKDVFFYDENNELYKIELKYWDKTDSSSLYFVVREDQLNMMKQHRYPKQDTLVIEETYFSSEKLMAINNTLLEQKQDLVITFDDFSKDEMKQMYFVGDKLVTIKLFTDNKLYGGRDNIYSDAGLLSKSWQYKLDGQYDHYSTEKITWNLDKTQITRINNRHDWGKVYYSYYKLSKNTEHYHNTDSSFVNNITFREKNKDFFYNFLLRKMGYDDALFGIHLLKTSLCRKTEEKVRRKGKTNVYNYDYKTNHKGQIFIEHKFKNDQLIYNAKYSYY